MTSPFSVGPGNDQATEARPSEGDFFAIDYSLHSARAPFSLEKWYIDVLLDDGTICLVYVGTVAICGRRLRRLTADLFRPGLPAIGGSVSLTSLVGGPGFLRSPAVSIEGDRLRFNTGGLSGDLIYRPRFAPWRGSQPFAVSGRRSLNWIVEIPDADVDGRLTWPGGGMDVHGRGYRDRVWFDVLPWRFPISRLVWGHATSETHAATWSSAATSAGPVTVAWIDGRSIESGPGFAPPPGIVLGHPRVLVDANVLDLEGLRLGMFRRPLGWLSGTPHETKWQAPCLIAGEPGIAVHELVTWNHPRCEGAMPRQ